MERAVLGIDSNVLVRFFTRDEAAQYAQAEALFEQARDRSLFLSVIVLVEVNWTLRRVYKRPAGEVLQTLEELVNTRQFVTEDRERVLRALALARSANVDFSDALIALRNAADGCDRTATFDRNAFRLADMAPVGEFLQ